MTIDFRGGRAGRGVLIALLACAGTVTGGRPIAAQPAPTQYARLSLVSEEPTFKPGAPAWVGVLFEMEPGWHIYWVNPGDAGDPPRLTWELPAGFAAKEIRWPVPIRLTLGPIVDYGYEGRVLLALPIDVPKSYVPGTPVTLAAEVRYVICKDVCIPARTRVTLSLPVTDGAAAASARRGLFAETRARWPQPLPAGWTVAATATATQLTLTMKTGKSESTAAFFPLEFDQVDNAAPQVATASATGVQLALTRADPDGPAPSALNGVVVLSGNRAYEVRVPVK